MNVRNLVLTMLGSAVLLGMAGGLVINTAMKPAPAPTLHHAVQSDQASNDSYVLVDSGPQDLSPAGYMDRLPTWKRRALLQSTAYVPASYPDSTPAAMPDGLADQAAPDERMEAAPARADGGDVAAERTGDAGRDAAVEVRGVTEQQDQPGRRDEAGAQ